MNRQGIAPALDPVELAQRAAPGDLAPEVVVWICTGLVRRSADVKPAGARARYPVHALRDVLPLLCRPTAAGKGGEIDPDRLTPSDRRAWYDGESKRRELQMRDRELIPAAEVAQVISTAFAAIATELRAIPDNFERHGAATPEQAERMSAASRVRWTPLPTDWLASPPRCAHEAP